MNAIVKMAWRNINRNRRRSVLAGISVALSLLLIVFLQGWIGGIMGTIVKNYTKNETGHVRIATADFERKTAFMPVTANLEHPDSIIARVNAAAPDLASPLTLISPRISFGVLLNNKGRNVAAMAMAGDPENEKQLLMLHNALLPGSRYIAQDNETIIGVGLARRLGFAVGDTLRIVATGSDYALRLKKAQIVGLFKTDIGQFDESLFQLPLGTARQLLGMEDGCQQLIVMLQDWRKSDRVAAQIRTVIPDTSIAVTSWTRIGDYYQMVKMSESTYRFLYLVIVFLGAFIISNIMMMVVLERRREIGILKSMGMRRSEILLLFLAEGTLLGVMGSVVGVAMGWTLVSILGVVGVDLTSMMQSIRMPMDNIVYPYITLASVGGSLLLGTVVAALVSLLPSRQAANMNAIEAMNCV